MVTDDNKVTGHRSGNLIKRRIVERGSNKKTIFRKSSWTLFLNNRLTKKRVLEESCIGLSSLSESLLDIRPVVLGLDYTLYRFIIGLLEDLFVGISFCLNLCFSLIFGVLVWVLVSFLWTGKWLIPLQTSCLRFFHTRTFKPCQKPHEQPLWTKYFQFFHTQIFKLCQNHIHYTIFWITYTNYQF